MSVSKQDPIQEIGDKLRPADKGAEDRLGAIFLDKR